MFSLQTYRSRTVALVGILLAAGLLAEAAAQLKWAHLNAGVTLNQVHRIPVSGGPGEIVAVGSGGTVMFSHDGIAWNKVSSIVDLAIFSVARANGIYLVTGSGGRVATSEDGQEWSVRNSGVTYGLNSIAWTGSLFVVAASGGSIVTSPDGINWTKRVSGIEPNVSTLEAVVWNGEKLVMVGAQGIILNSYDGIQWERQQSGTTAGLRSVVWVPPNGSPGSGQFVVVGVGGAVLTSSDGETWVSRVSGTGATLTSVVWSGGDQPDPQGARYTAVGFSGSSSTQAGIFLTSPDGAAWTQVQVPGVIGLLNSVAWTGERYVIVGNNSNMFVSHEEEILSAPTLASPVQDATGVPIQATLSWVDQEEARSYHAQISANSGFTSLLLNDSAITENTRMAGPLSDDTEFYWRVRSRTLAGYSAWSEIRKFRTILLPPATPQLDTPLHGAASQTVHTTLTWGTVPKAAGYRMQVAKDASFSTPVLDDSSMTLANRAVGPLDFGTMHYWRVRAWNAAGVSLWSETRTFTTEAMPTGVPPAPILVTPEQFAQEVPLAPALQWQFAAGAVTHHLQLASNPTFVSLVHNDSGLTLPYRSIIPLPGNSAFYWRVRGRNSHGVGPWSETRTFNTITVIPGVPSLISPMAFASEISAAPTLAWSAVTGASAYTVQLSQNSSFAGESLLNDNTDVTSVGAGPLVGNTAYYWRVRAKNSAGESDWSTARMFTTGQGTHLLAGEFVPRFRHLAGADILRFNLPRTERVLIRISDIRGRQLYVRDELLHAGTHEFIVHSLPRDGVYLLDFRAGDTHEVIKLLP